MWLLMHCLISICYFLNSKSKFLNLITYLSCIAKILNFHISLQIVKQKPQGGYHVNQGYLFKEGKLYIPLGSHRKLLVKQTHEGGLMGHFGSRKDIEHVKRENFLSSHQTRHPEELSKMHCLFTSQV